MSRLSVLVACVGLTACASSNKNEPNSSPVSASVQGTYAFTANLPDQQLRGRLRVIGKEILLEPASGTCRPMEGTDSVAVRFLCNVSGRYEQVSIRIDRRKPAERSTWSASYRVQRTRQVCAEYRTVAGQQVCMSTHPEYYETTEGKAGRLAVRRES